MDIYLISRLPRQEVEAFVEQVDARGSSYLGPQYDLDVREIVRTDSLDTVITLARNRHNPMPELFFEEEWGFAVFSGYVVDDLAKGRLSRFFGSFDGDGRPIRRSPGGIYSYATVRRTDGQVCVGHSTPTLEPAYFSQGESDLHVGNHPLLVHVAGNGFSRPTLDDRFYLSAVNAGVAIDDSTPFLGCYRIPPRQILVNRPTAPTVVLRSAPRPAYGRFRYSTRRQRRDAIKGALMEAGSILERLPRGEMRTSGGKDSRLLAAFVKYAGIPVIPVNQNFPGEVEGQVADMVARELGFPACERFPITDRSTPEAIERGTLRKVAYAGGLPAVAVAQYPNLSEGSTPGIPLIMGHAHLQRGGLNNRIRSVTDAMTTAMSRTVSPFLRAPYAEPNRRIVARFVGETLAREGVSVQSLSFHAYLQYSMNYQFQSLYAYVRNWNPLITPLVDERFALLCEDIADSPASRRPGEYAGITDLWNEHVAMGAIEALAPSLLDFPLAGYRFRADVPERPGFDARDPGLVVDRSLEPEEYSKLFNTKYIGASTRRTLWERIEATEAVATFAELTCRPEVWRYVSDPDSSTPPDMKPAPINQFVWSLYGLSMILGEDWWTEVNG